MQLPDEAVEYDYSGLMAPPGDGWTPLDELRAKHLLAPEALDQVREALIKIRMGIAADRSAGDATGKGRSADAVFVDYPEKLSDRYKRKSEASELGRMIAAAERLRGSVDRVVVLGSGGGLLGSQAILGALSHAHHNELPSKDRLGSPRVYFAGDSLDGDALGDLRNLLEVTCVEPADQDERWGAVVVSPGGDAIETLAAYRALRHDLQQYYRGQPDYLRKYVIPVAGPTGRLRELAKADGFADDEILPLPEGLSGRFSALTPAGLLPAALVKLDVSALLLGAAAMTRRFVEQPFERNPVLQYAAVNHLLATTRDKTVRVTSVWSKRLEKFGDWYGHLLSESLGKQGRGPTPMTVVQTRDIHSRGQHLFEGARDKVVHQIVVRTANTTDPIKIGMADRNEDDLNALSRKSYPDLLAASLMQMNKALAESGRPVATITLPVLSEYTMGQLMQMLMLATVVEGRLLGVNPYGQPGVEAHQKGLNSLLRG